MTESRVFGYECPGKGKTLNRTQIQPVANVSSFRQSAIFEKVSQCSGFAIVEHDGR